MGGGGGVGGGGIITPMMTSAWQLALVRFCSVSFYPILHGFFYLFAVLEMNLRKGIT